MPSEQPRTGASEVAEAFHRILEEDAFDARERADRLTRAHEVLNQALQEKEV